jgi:maltooligosyltrehalose trehalohydrolase
MAFSRRLPIGAEVMPGGGIHVRVLAPRRRRVAVVLESATDDPRAREVVPVSLEPEADGYFAGRVPERDY